MRFRSPRERPAAAALGHRRVLAAILELDPSDAPLPLADHPRPWTVWRNWLGGRGLGPVPVLAPSDFNWPHPVAGAVPVPLLPEALLTTAG